jgi:hypothetical protein
MCRFEITIIHQNDIGIEKEIIASALNNSICNISFSHRGPAAIIPVYCVDFPERNGLPSQY